MEIYTPSVPNDEKPQSYEHEVTDKSMLPLIGVTDSKPIERKDIELYPKNYAMLLFNVLSPNECKYYIDTMEEKGMIPAQSQTSYRNNDRVVINSKEVADLIWERISPYIQPIEITPTERHKVESGYGIEGIWKPKGLNTIWRLAKYNTGGHFAPHYDGNIVLSSQLRSMKTFMLYLNGGFEGGTTNFVDENQRLYKDPETGRYTAEEKNILLRIKPEPGMAIIFNHAILHEGEQVKTGIKYIMRSDILFSKETVNLEDPKEKQAMLLFQEAERLESDGKAMDAVECYKKAFKLWPPLADAYNS